MTDEADLIVKLRYVHEDVDRHGNARIYFWRGKGHRRIRIKAEPDSPEFRAAYDAALAGTAPVQDDAQKPLRPDMARAKPGTWQWLCGRYFRECADFLQLGQRTRHVRKMILGHTFDEPMAPGETVTFAAFPVERMTDKTVRILRDRKAAVPAAANERLKAIRQVFEWARKADGTGVSANVAKDVEYFNTGSEGHHTWTVTEIEQFEERHPIGTMARLALALIKCTGARRSDLIRFGRQMVRNGVLTFTEVKGRRREMKEHQIPILPELADIIEKTPSNNLTFLVTEFGNPFTHGGFGNWFRKRCDEAGLPHCAAHGMRKASATIAAENGATEHQLMAIYGWTTTKQAGVYTRKARRNRLAADGMHLLIPVKK